ncbi:MAG: ParA family protein [Alphaproteobacteria bacterium]|nr:ParA family protein [Alphaproteobacteria bacterium]
MPVISLSSAKGGVGKTTLTTALGAAWALRGEAVHVIDADPRGHASRHLGAFGLDHLTVETATKATIVRQISAARTTADVVLVDLPGAGEDVLTFAVSRSNLVILPTGPSAMDITDATRTWEAVAAASEALDRHIQAVFMLTRVKHFRTSVASHARAQLEGAGFPVLRSELIERVAFQEMMFHNKPLAQIGGADGAAANVAAILAEIEDILASMAKAAA